jgi:hypothetical protein
MKEPNASSGLKPSSAYGKASLLSRLTYSWVSPLISKGNGPITSADAGDRLTERDADGLAPPWMDARALAARLEWHLSDGEQAETVGNAHGTSTHNMKSPHTQAPRIAKKHSLLLALLACHWRMLAVHAFLILVVLGLL